MGWRRVLTSLLITTSACFAPCAESPAAAQATADSARSAGPSTRRSIELERLEGALLIPFALRMGGLDTAGCALLDTGAGFLAIDRSLAARIGYAPDTTGGLAVLPAPITGVGLGGPDTIRAYPAIALDLAGVRAATDRNVLALAGAALFREQALILDPERDELGVVYSPHVADSNVAVRVAISRNRLRGVLGTNAIAVPFDLRADDKIVIRATLDGRTAMRLILDTGATKLALFVEPLRRVGASPGSKRRMRGLRAPTVYGDAAVDFVRLGELRLDDALAPCTERGLDAALLDTPLAEALGRTVGEPVHGLLGYSFLRRFRHAVDYGARVLWLERRDTGLDEREHEYCTIGVQLHRPDGITRVAGVVRDAAAARAGVRVGDEILTVDGVSASTLSLLHVVRALEGEPGSSVRIEWRRGARRWSRALTRERLL